MTLAGTSIEFSPVHRATHPLWREGVGHLSFTGRANDALQVQIYNHLSFTGCANYALQIQI